MKYAFSSLAVVAAFGATTAHAGGYTPAIVEPVPAAPVVEVAQAGDWQGAYGGVSLGYAFRGDDKVGYWTNGTLVDENIGKAELHGLNGGLRVGYRWQRNKWVFGPELSVEGGNVKDSFNNATFGEVESKLKNQVALKMKTGYEVQPNMIVFGTAGVSRGSFDYKIGNLSESYTANGYVFGLGVERKVNDRMSVTGEVERNYFKRETVKFGNTGISTEASPAFTNVKLGLNFKF